MGKKPDEIEQQIRAQRAELTHRMEAVQSRVQDDMHSVRDEAQDRASNAVGDAKGIFKDNGLFKDHPMSMMAGALGLGVALGIASEGFGNGRDSGGSSAQETSSRSSQNDGTMNQLFGSILGSFGTSMQDEIRSFIQDGFDTLRGKSGISEENAESNRQADERQEIVDRRAA